MAFGTPTWLATLSSARPGVTTRPLRRVGCAAMLQSGTPPHTPQSIPTSQRVKPSSPATQSSKGPHVSPSVAQSMTLSQSSSILPHAYPASAQVCGPQSGSGKSIPPVTIGVAFGPELVVLVPPFPPVLTLAVVLVELFGVSSTGSSEVSLQAANKRPPTTAEPTRQPLRAKRYTSPL